MNVVIWIVTALVAAAFAAAGLLKLVRPKPALQEQGMAWTDDFSAGQVKSIGLLEVLGAVGLILPGALGVATTLTPLAGVGLFLVMAGAVVTHLRRGERAMVPPGLVLGVLALVIAILRFGPYSF